MAKLVQQRMNVGKHEATRLVRTEMNYVQNQAALDSIKDAEMKYYIFLATLDKKHLPYAGRMTVRFIQWTELRPEQICRRFIRIAVQRLRAT